MAWTWWWVYNLVFFSVFIFEDGVYIFTYLESHAVWPSFLIVVHKKYLSVNFISCSVVGHIKRNHQERFISLGWSTVMTILHTVRKSIRDRHFRRPVQVPEDQEWNCQKDGVSNEFIFIFICLSYFLYIHAMDRLKAYSHGYRLRIRLILERNETL